MTLTDSFSRSRFVSFSTTLKTRCLQFHLTPCVAVSGRLNVPIINASQKLIISRMVSRSIALSLSLVAMRVAPISIGKKELARVLSRYIGAGLGFIVVHVIAARERKGRLQINET